MIERSKKDWFVLCTKARQEFRVLECLNQLGILEVEHINYEKDIINFWN